jgi:hypothetical protein
MKPADSNTLDEFLLDRYTSSSCWRDKPRRFRIKHEPWLQTRVFFNIDDDPLLHLENWFTDAEFIGANCSHGTPPSQAMNI